MLQRMNSIMQTAKRCYICGSCAGLERHHVLSGTANRKLSEKYGLWVWLCHEHHTGKHGVQYDPELNRRTKREAQLAFEIDHGREEWMRIFRKNYL